MSASIPGIPIRYTGPVDCIRHIYCTHGLRGCFTGLNATVMREITGFSIYITSYELMCDRMTPEGASECSVRTMLLAGGLSGMVSWMVNIPIDIIKSRLQVDDFARPKYSGTWDCARSSYRASGWRIFWRGLPVTCIRAFPVNAVTFAVYSSTLKALSEMTAEA
ncbi:hypothetical protein NP493_558g01034 [Ridgeia piscesae]|uniref:Mitochondrial carrier protein n=1 Tax=Ridgeia piscesae TaxID=27915 RepID=A0AAD9MRV9_RIDPI|nr:hypothetical protein NP493_5593g00004 [Ridgeia piscesae]KAK2178119.1 hypothetical protein NP493_558g01034 [Ridgeia piscesae]